MDSSSPWTGHTTSSRPAYPTPTFVREQGLQPPAALQPSAVADEDAGRWYREWVASHDAASPAAPPACSSPAVGSEPEDEDEVIWVPQDDGSDSEIEFVEAVARPPPPPPVLAYAPPLPVPNPRPKPSLLPLPDAVALPSGPLGTNHFVPFAPPAPAGGSASGPPKRGSKLVDLLVLPSDASKEPAFAPPAFFALGPSNKGHELMRRVYGWDGRALGQPVHVKAAVAAATSTDLTHDLEQPAALATARIAPISTSLLPPQRGLSSALLSQKRVTHSFEQIEASRRQARAELASSVPSARERARKDRDEREHRKSLAAALNAP